MPVTRCKVHGWEAASHQGSLAGYDITHRQHKIIHFRSSLLAMYRTRVLLRGGLGGTTLNGNIGPALCITVRQGCRERAVAS